MVDRESLALRAFGWTDDQGGTTITRLSNLRENARIADREFEFRFPPGVIIR
jgi:outer membrane lipoprotein-sorting protein